ncbi:hypothetical protein HNQ81_001153 [Desulfoprunum benzoelyticum]|uniref:Uncharacterized protein n=1 Tax=Desulfoprunum benzoelyticum TaxID=1506996 RepID=A0A840UMC8_9BACT|nr:hypothetical protein [Desulfoprunum benzoelyticum]
MKSSSGCEHGGSVFDHAYLANGWKDTLSALTRYFKVMHRPLPGNRFHPPPTCRPAAARVDWRANRFPIYPIPIHFGPNSCTPSGTATRGQ